VANNRAKSIITAFAPERYEAFKMTKYFLVFIFLIVLHSCQNTDNGKERMNVFMQGYKDYFLESDLTLLNYNPRVKFEYYSDSFSYRLYPRRDNKLMISIWNEGGLIDTNNNIQRFLSDYVNLLNDYKSEIGDSLNFSSIWLVKDKENNLVLSDDSSINFQIPVNSFDFDPVSYFNELDSLVTLFGILEIQKDEDYIKLVFNEDNSLYYFPSNSVKDKKLIEDMVKIDEQWYISNEKTNIDYY